MRKIKFIYVVCLILLGLVIPSNLLKASDENIGTIAWIEGGDLREENVVFKKAFTECYKDITLEELKIGQPDSRYHNLDQFLDASFEDDKRDLTDKKDNVYFLHVLSKQQETIGYVSFDIENKEVGKQAYIRALSVDPSVERQGIGERLVFAILDKDPSLKRIYLVTRKVNQKAQNFYTRLGFKQSQDVHADLDPNIYVGYEKQLSYNAPIEQTALYHGTVKGKKLMESFVLELPIADIRVSTIPTRDNTEPLVDIEEVNNPRLRHFSTFEEKYKMNRNDEYFKVRRGLLSSLVKMLSFLPNDIGIAYFEGYRPLSKQKEYFIHKYRELRAQLSPSEAYQEASKYVSPFIENIPVHCTGGAIDISLFKIDHPAYLLDLGKFGTLWGPNEQSHSFCETISTKQEEHRVLLFEAAKTANLVNYGYEWWHFSYGDKAWAYIKKKANAIYGLPNHDCLPSLAKEEFIQQMEEAYNLTTQQ